jgi:hypothetical protein
VLVVLLVVDVTEIGEVRRVVDVIEMIEDELAEAEVEFVTAVDETDAAKELSIALLELTTVDEFSGTELDTTVLELEAALDSEIVVIGELEDVSITTVELDAAVEDEIAA